MKNKEHCPNCSSQFFDTEEKMKRTTPPKQKKTHPFYKGPLISYGYRFLEHKCRNCETIWEGEKI